MKSFWGLIPRYLWKNKKRTLSTAVAIILSVILVMAAVIMKKTYLEYEKQINIDGEGLDWHIATNVEEDKNIDKLRQDELVKDLTVTTYCFAQSISKKNPEYYIKLRGFDDNAGDFYNFKFIEGRGPEKDDEIALEEWILPYLDKDYKVGDRIELECLLDDVEEDEPPVKYEFTLTGVFTYKSSYTDGGREAQGWVRRSFTDKEKKKYNSRIKQCQVYIRLKSIKNLDGKCTMLNNDPNYPDMHFQRSMFKFGEYYSRIFFNTITTILFIFIAIVDIVNIYNIFSVSVEERRREFGILRALGCTAGKVKSLIICEGFFIGIISIFLGIIFGNLITKGMMVLVGAQGMETLLVFPLEGVISSVIIGLISVLAGSYFPARKSEKIAPIEAINGLERTNVKGGDIRIEDISIFRRKPEFSISMALINIKRNKKRFRTSVVSIAIVLILIVSSIYLIGLIDAVKTFKEQYGEGDFKVTTAGNNYLKTVDVDSIKETPGIELLSKEKYLEVKMHISKEQLTSQGYSYLEGEAKHSEDKERAFKNKQFELQSGIFAYDEEKLNSLKAVVLDGEIGPSEEPVIYIAQGIHHLDYTSVKVGDTIKVIYDTYDERGSKSGVNMKAFRVGAIIKDEAVKINNGSASIGGVISSEDASKYLGLDGYSTLRLGIKDGTGQSEAKTNLEEVMQNIRAGSLSAYKDDLKAMKKSMIKITFILYTFVFIVGIVSIINLINIMKMNVLTRQKEVGLLRAIGFGTDEVRKMISAEGALYGIVSGIAGSLIGNLLTYSLSKMLGGSNWKFPFVTFVLMIIITIIITTLTSLIASRQLFKNSIVDSIKSVE